ncbi:gamma-glutamyltransferase [Novosphingobium sp. PASSN1]|uniref:gamma-glutamyltransferase n=1 Tax=Novosphingobium sp. PASSN1 TaxID=2015561 RepID=UPI000BD99755|nr:gamma-glutamyltransferase [Novosphingobium sp. PASSN1]OYU36405.1 MAG: gamma-glutamyltransferase [Novosphingobium sp. PASSN1]
MAFRFARSLAPAALLVLAQACAPLPNAAQPAASELPKPALPASKLGVTTAADPRAAAAGAEMLRLGGSATDAAIAMMLALTVVEPQSSGIGGGGFLVTADSAGTVESFDGREKAPAAASPDWFKVDGKVLSHSDAVPGGRSVGVPGNLRLAATAHKLHGKLPWRVLFGPAIRLAGDGFAITPRLASTLAMAPEIAGLDPAGRALFFGADGAPLPAGTVVHNPALAETFAKAAALGADSFYTGENARAIAAKVGTAPRNPAPMSTADIAAYKAKSRDPVCGRYRVWRVCSMGPPSAGGIIVLQTLGALERFDLKAMGRTSPTAWHLIAEAERLAFADRDAYLADPDFVPVPTAGLIDPAYIAARSALISETAAINTAAPGKPAGATGQFAMGGPVPEHGTTHFAAVDRWGNAASYTSTIESAFGSGLMVGGYYLNNELTDFNLDPNQDGKPTANRVEGGKRPRSSMSPVVVYGPDGHIRLVAGAAGGYTIPPQVIRVIIGTLDWNLPAREAIAQSIIMPAPGGVIALEAGTPQAALVPALQALGHAKVVTVPMRLKANAIEWIRDAKGKGHWVGAADPRSEGAAASP